MHTRSNNYHVPKKTYMLPPSPSQYFWISSPYRGDLMRRLGVYCPLRPFQSRCKNLEHDPAFRLLPNYLAISRTLNAQHRLKPRQAPRHRRSAPCGFLPRLKFPVVTVVVHEPEVMEAPMALSRSVWAGRLMFQAVRVAQFASKHFWKLG